jgi:hypothetical protein
LEVMKRFVILGHHLPRHYGIAPFTTHLADRPERESSSRASVQRDYGIVGGKADAHLLTLLREFRIADRHDALHRAIRAEFRAAHSHRRAGPPVRWVMDC